MRTDEEFEQAIRPHIKARVQLMTDEQAKVRCAELSKKLDVPKNPEPLGLISPEPTAMEEHEEYFLLKKRLGCKK